MKKAAKVNFVHQILWKMFLAPTSHSFNNDSSGVWRLDKTWGCLLKIKCDGCLRCIITSSANNVQFWHLKKLLETFEYFGGFQSENILMLCLGVLVIMPLILDRLQKMSLMMIICQNNCRNRASSLKGGTLWNNCMTLIFIGCCTTIQENPKFQHQQSSTAQSKNQKPRCSLIVHFKRLLQAPMNNEEWWFWGRLMLSLRFWCHPGPSLPVQVREDLGQGSIVGEACLQHLRDHSD